MSFSPVAASKHITEKYYRYLKTSFKMPDPYSFEFEHLIDSSEPFAAGPYLDVTDAFKKGKSISELISEGVLPSTFSKIRMNLDRPLYLHQEKAVRKIANEHRNLVVSTGTGSGKTESFLIPVLRELVMEAENGVLCPGVRTLLIYPMNALANDQTERLRELLSDYPDITFGVYTGQTKQKKEEALAEYKSLNQNRSPIANELISRDEMISTPPHILITNYAMLEYLMLRPRDSVFFDGEWAKHWKFIVFDEAHVYNGSTGIEVSMLFRRLKAKLGAQNITYILTSATLGEKEDDAQVAEFAQKLCNAPFSATDIVRADRITPSAIHEVSMLPLSFYKMVAEAKNNNDSDEEILSHLTSNCIELKDFLYEKIVHDSNYWKMRSLLSAPKTVAFLCSAMGWTEKQLTDFVSVASLAEKDGGKLFDARYHMFLRATESVFVTLAPDNRVMLHRSNYRIIENGSIAYKVFEVATCSYCNALYLVGKIENNRLEQYNQFDDLAAKELFLLSPTVSDTDSDHSFENEGIDAEGYSICPYCGFLRKEGSSSHCEHDPSMYIKVFRIKLSGERHTLTKCPRCENVNTAGVLRMFFSGQEASTSVIGTALFEELPSYRVVQQKCETSEDEFGLTFAETEKAKEKLAKQFIAFSDSRQAAAFYASYLNISYNNILYKRLILEALKKVTQVHGDTLPAFVDRVQTEFEIHGVRGRASLDPDSEYSVKKEAWKAVLAELIDSNGNTSLAHFGLLGVDWNVPGSYKNYDITEPEFRDLCSVIAMSMMSDAALSYDAPLNDNDLEDFTHGSTMYAYTLSDSDARKHHKAFIPTKSGTTNKRVDYVQRVLNKKGYSLTVDEVAVFLKKVFEKVLVGQGLLSRTEGNAYQVNTSKLSIFNPQHWYICGKCKRLTCHNVANVCPAYHCDGELTGINPENEFSGNHYYRLFRELEIRDLRIVEHTAQLNRDMAYDYQKRFKQKEIDVLSCSTTFEMGVDVGSLETVFMRNMPPMPANYAQRAGRAGRSSQSAAFALTFCNKSSHDFSYFNDPTKMIKGKIDPPKYTVENDRIAIRHLYAAALSSFWRIHPEYFKTIGTFLEKDETGNSGVHCLTAYLASKPDTLRQYLLKFLPATLSDKFQIQTFGWVESLIGEEGVLTEAVKTYEYEVSLLENAKKERLDKNYAVDGITQRIKAYYNEDILSFFSRKNILPKYGFPVDTVEMTVTDNKHGKKYGLQLQRDLSMAISEYAPGSQIVANNNLITSRYIKKIPNIGWKMYSYIQCDDCKTLNVKPYTEEDDDNQSINECCQCHKVFSSAPKVFLIPAQGFAADGDKIRKPGLKKPERTYRGEISYVGFTEVEAKLYQIGKAIVEVKSSQNDEMAVLNTSPFYVCQQCGYTEMDAEHYTNTLTKKHKISSGFPCSNQKLRRFSLGYRFLTDVVRIRFENYEINEFEKGLSILHGFLRGVCTCLNIEENDISGCLQSNPIDGRWNYSIVIFDNTPGGAGHAKRLDDPQTLERILRQTLRMMKGCVCGGDEGDSSCYSCLRNYRNQKYHDILKRKYVIEFLQDILNEQQEQ